MTGKQLFYALAVICSILTSSSWATLSASDRGSKKPEKDSSKIAEQDDGPKYLTESLEDLGLLKTTTSRKTLLKYNGYASQEVKKNFASPTLGFVTPWNNYGYDFAREFAPKFDMISPVWLQMRADFQHQACFFTGTHDYDAGWMADLKKRNRNIKIVPRIIFEDWSKENFKQLFSEEEFMHSCIRLILSETQAHDFGGVVIEMWLQAGLEFKEDMIHFLADLKIALSAENKLTILVLPPAIRDLNTAAQVVTRQDFAAIAPHIDYATLMTYDFFHTGARPAATAPLPWVRANVELLTVDGDPNRAKLLTGLNFYGYDFFPGQYPKPVIARDFLDILKKQKPSIKWDSFSHENYVEFDDKKSDNKHTVYYPTPMSMSEKIDQARMMKTGLMIWELGQGFRIFGELL